MLKLYLALLPIVLIFSSACDNNNDEQLPLVREDSEDYFGKSHELLADTWSYGKPLYYEPSALFPGKVYKF